MLTYKELITIEELTEVQKLERLVWDMEPIPTHQTLTAVKNGGIMMGVYDGEKLVGFCYGFAGFDSEKTFLCSHMMGIHPDYRSKGVGEKLKWRQREIAIRKGYDMIKWTYDPLQAPNAYLNLTKLHGVCYTYYENCYGEMTDGINKGLPSDRFEISWHITSPHVKEPRILANTSRSIGRYVEEGAFGKLELQLPEVWNEPFYSVPILLDIQAVKEQNPPLALDWRMKLREVFTTAFSNGYAVVSVKRNDTYHEYILAPKNTIELEGEHTHEN